MRQRLGLAQALISRPSVLFLDEPVSALDLVGRKDALGLIERLRGEATVFMSTHISADVERVCDTVGILARGPLLTSSLDEATLQVLTTMHPVQRLGTSEEVAALIVFLTSDAAAFITGSYRLVDGGYTAQ